MRRPATLAPCYDTAHLPRYLFFGAGAMALITLAFLLCFELPDIFARMGWVMRNAGHLVRQNRLHVIGTAHVPAIGPVLLVPNCADQRCRRTLSRPRTARFAGHPPILAT